MYFYVGYSFWHDIILKKQHKIHMLIVIYVRHIESQYNEFISIGEIPIFYE